MSRSLERLVIDDAISRFVSASEEERCRLYRLRLQATVISASPLAIELAAQSGLTMSDIGSFLPVPPLWPTAGASLRRPVRRPKNRIACVPWLVDGPTPETAVRLGRTGVAVRAFGNPLGDLGFVPEGSAIEAISTIGGTTLHTSRGNGFLLLDATLPQTALVSLAGRSVGTVVSHPALDGRGYVIDLAWSDEFVGGCVIRFSTGLVPIELPWADQLAREVDGCVEPLADYLTQDARWMTARYERFGA